MPRWPRWPRSTRCTGAPQTGEYLVGVCTNTLCAIMGGDAILEVLENDLGVHAGQTTSDGRITLEHIECNAACDYAPVVMVNWEFFDNQTPSSARELVDRPAGGRARRTHPRCRTVLLPRDGDGHWPASGHRPSTTADRERPTLARACASRRRTVPDGEEVMTPLTPVLSRFWDEPEPWTLRDLSAP